jgi:hypothetical protein
LHSESNDRSRYIFPEPDLLRTLVDSYFTEVNPVYPLLHRPTLDRLVHDGIHFLEDGFARVLLTICAVASRFVDDPRVFLDGHHSLSAGWKYFNQVQLTQMSFLSPSLYEIQLYCVSISVTPLLSISHRIPSFLSFFCKDLRLPKGVGQS